MKLKLLVPLAMLVLSALPALAQGRRSAISGVARDETGAVLPNVTVKIHNVDTGITRTVATDGEGRYRAPLLELGQYEVAAELAGFKTYTRKGIELTLEREAVVDITLSVGAVAQGVTVTGEVPLVDTSSSALSNLVDEKKIRDLPLNGRDYVQLATLQPGIHVARAQGNGANTGQGVQISIAGSRPVQNNFRLDGSSVTDYTGSTPGSINGVNLGVDSVREFSVLSSTYGAQYGRSAGGVVNAVTRSGTNALHGSLFYFHRNDNLDARNFFDEEEPPEFRRHQFGLTAGGPIRKSKTFFFTNYEGLREARGDTTIATTVSDSARQGLLRSGPVRVDPTIAKVLDLYPRPNGDVLGDTGLFVFPNPEVANENFVTTRVDHSLGKSDSLFGRYTFDDGGASRESTFRINSLTDSTRNQSFTLEDTHIFSPRVINAARLGFLRVFSVNDVSHAKNSLADSPDLVFLPGRQGMGLIDISGLTEFPGGTDGVDHDVNAYNSYQVYNDLTWARGGHFLKIGGSLERTHFNADSQSQQSGVYTFANLAAFLTNRPQQFSAQLPTSDTIRGWRQWIPAFYLQDDWKARRNLTVNLGLRYEFATVPHEVNGKVANIDQVTSAAMRVGDPLFDNPSLHNLAPRVGLAWDPFGKGKTSIRAGYGIFYDLILSQFIINSGVRNPPFFVRGSITGLQVGDFPKGGLQRFLQNAQANLRAERIARDVAQPYVQQWNFNLQHELGFDTVVTAGYVGSHGVHVTAIVEDANLAIPQLQTDGRLFFPTNGTKQNRNFSMIRNRLFDGASFYHGLHLGLQKRWSHGVQYQVAYTFAKSIDDDSSTFSHDEAANAVGIPVNGNHKFNRGLSTFDVRHSFVSNATWSLPSPKNSLKYVLGGWQAGTIISHQSGLPFSATLGYDAARTRTNRANRQGGQRPDLVAGRSNNPATGDPTRWFDITAFARPTPGFLGNLGRNTITGPSQTNVDFTLIRQIPIRRLGEAGRLDFRAEFFNLLNHANFRLPTPGRMQVFTSTGITEDAGRITAADPGREIQFGLKLIF